MRKKQKLLPKDTFFQPYMARGEALTYDQIRLRTGYSELDAGDANITSQFSRHLALKIPILSAAMDTVTEYKMAIVMAKAGGLGIIHRGLAPDDQVEQVKRVKFHLNGLIEKPICVSIVDRVETITARREEKGWSFSSFPVLNDFGEVLGLVTRNDFDFCTDSTLMAGAIMTPFDELVTAPPKTSLQQAYEKMRKAGKKILLLVGRDRKLAGMYVWSDLKRLVHDSSSIFTVDAAGHLRVGAAIGTREAELDRAQLLVEAKCDVLVIDTAHGDSKNVYDILRRLKRQYPTVDIVVGNVSEPDSAKRLLQAGADGIKIGQGPGSICSTRIVTGIGCPQATAVYACAKIARGSGVPVCADGGINQSGDVPIALALGAHTVMLGRLLAGTTEAPGTIIDTPKGRFKLYRGMGSLSAMQESQASRDRYRQGNDKRKLVPEGVESLIPHQGNVADVLQKMVGGLQGGMGYVGARTIAELHRVANFHFMGEAGARESAPHDVNIIDPASTERLRQT